MKTKTNEEDELESEVFRVYARIRPFLEKEKEKEKEKDMNLTKSCIKSDTNTVK
jgi:hypothetical protein